MTEREARRARLDEVTVHRRDEYTGQNEFLRGWQRDRVAVGIGTQEEAGSVFDDEGLIPHGQIRPKRTTPGGQKIRRIPVIRGLRK